MKVNPDLNLIVILGPTASGKTSLGARLAKEIGSEVISADSRQVYRGMDIGTGKDLEDYIVDGFAVPYHLIDIAEPAAEFSVYDYQQAFYQCFREMRSRGIIPVLVGGTGMYLESVLLGYEMPRAPADQALRAGLESKSIEELIIYSGSINLSFIIRATSAGGKDWSGQSKSQLHPNLPVLRKSRN